MMFLFRQLQEKSSEQCLLLNMVFVDVTKAFDTVTHSGLYNILKTAGLH